MKSTALAFAIGLVAGSSPLSGQINFSGSDVFSSVVAGNWSSDTTSTGGAFSVAGGLLNFTDAGLATGESSSAKRSWILNSGSSTADWQVQLDLSLNASQIAGQVTYWNFSLQDSSNTTNYFLVDFTRSYGQLNPFVRGTTYTNNTIGTSQQVDITSSNTVTILTRYNASTQTLTFAYDANGATDGYSFTDLYSSDIGSSGAAWNMTSGETFSLQLSATNSAFGSATSSLGAGLVFADNFLATSAIPEPTTTAALLGMLAWIAAGLRARNLRRTTGVQ